MAVFSSVILVIVSSIIGLTGAQFDGTCATCPDAWIYFRGSCYLFSDFMNVSWTEAAHHCEIHHSELVVVDNKAEDSFIQDHALKLFRNVADRKNSSFWLGATDEIVEGLWTRYTDDSSLTYVNWAPGQPDSYGGSNQDCLCLTGDDTFRWHDVECNRTYHPICEKK